MIIYLATEFLSLTFSTHPIDIYHEGQRLSSAFKSLLDDSLWSGSYVTIGIIYETIGTKFIWQMFTNVVNWFNEIFGYRLYFNNKNFISSVFLRSN